jgi:plastocyanin
VFRTVSKFALALGCVLALVIGGCGSSSDKSSSSSSSSSSTQQKTTASSGGGGGSTVAVSMKSIAFVPASVTVKKGGTVKWTNDDSVGHDVTKESGPGPNFKSGSAGGLQGGDTFQQKFDTAGTIKYRCTVHPNMQATVTVK